MAKDGKKPTNTAKSAAQQQQQQLANTQAAQRAAMAVYQSMQNRFAPMTPQQNQQLSKLMFPDVAGGIYSPQQLRQQTQATLKGVVAPQMKYLTDMYRSRSQQGSKSITGFTNTYSDRLGQIGPQIAKNNQQLMSQTATIDAGLADYVRDSGSSLANELTQKLAPVGLSEGQLAGTVGNVSEFGQIASGELAGQFGATLERMAGEGNAWQNWGSALPGIGVLQGAQNLANFQGDLNRSFADQAAQLAGKVPELGLQIYQDLVQSDLARRGMKQTTQQARANFYGDREQTGLNSLIAQAGIASNVLDSLTSQYGTDASLYGSLVGDAAGFDASVYGQQSPGSLTAEERAAQEMRTMPLKQALPRIWGAVATEIADYPQTTDNPFGKTPAEMFEIAKSRIRAQLSAVGRKATDGQIAGAARLALRSIGVQWPPPKNGAPAVGGAPPAAPGNAGDGGEASGMSLGEMIRRTNAPLWSEGYFDTLLGGLLR